LQGYVRPGTFVMGAQPLMGICWAAAGTLINIASCLGVLFPFLNIPQQCDFSLSGLALATEPHPGKFWHSLFTAQPKATWVPAGSRVLRCWVLLLSSWPTLPPQCQQCQPDQDPRGLCPFWIGSHCPNSAQHCAHILSKMCLLLTD
jgi:hypothetical protein